MKETRERSISSIRANIMYLPDRELRICESFVRTMAANTYSSDAEWSRPVLTMDAQKEADNAYRFMDMIGHCLACSHSYSPACILEDVNAASPADSLVVGWNVSDSIVIDVQAVMREWRDAGYILVMTADMIHALEKSGYTITLPRQPKTAVRNGKRRIVVFVAPATVQDFVNRAKKEAEI